MKPFHIHTPLLLSRPISAVMGVPVYLKMDALQPIGSYKIRGIGLACQRALERGYRHLISASGGNAGYAVAYAGNLLGVKTTVVMPKTSSPLMSKLIGEENAQVEIHGDTLDDASIFAENLAKQMNAAYIHPFDHPDIWEGHASMITEIIQDGVMPGAVVVAVGGGGMLCGVVQGLQAHGLKDVPVVAMEAEGASSLYRSVEAGKLVGIDKIETMALSLGAKKVAQMTYDWTKHHTIDVQLCSDPSALKACIRFANDHRVLVEPACGVALTAVYDKRIATKNISSVVVIVCGGANVSLELFEQWKKIVSL